MEFQHELIIPNEGFPFKLFLFEGRNGNYVREKHWHTSIEIFAVMEGSLYFYIDEKEYPLKAGEFLIINSNEVHSIQAPVRNETIVLQIPLKQFSDYFTAQRFIRFRSRNEESEETDRRMVSGRCIGCTYPGKRGTNSVSGQCSMKSFILWFLHTGKQRWRRMR